MSATILKFLLLTGAIVPVVFASQGPEKIKDIDGLRRSIESNTLSVAERKAFGLDCQDQASLSYVSLQKDQREAILQVFGTGCSEERVLLVFGGGVDNWTLLSTLHLSSHYDEQPTVTFPSLVEPGVEEVMVEHQIVDWGTGVLQKFTTIYKWLDGHFQVVFDEPDFVHLEAASAEAPDHLYELDQKSTFVIKTDDQASGAKTLTEHQTITQGKRKITRVREWAWESSLQRFRCFDVVP